MNHPSVIVGQSNFVYIFLTAAYPFSSKLMQHFDEESANKVHTAAVCVYPSRVKDAYEKLGRLNKLNAINIAAGSSINQF